MKKLKINNEWFIGGFKESVYKTDLFEVGYKKYKKGFIGEKHLHKVATELNFIINGRVKYSGIVCNENELMVINPNEITEFEVLEDCSIMVIKTPSIKNDKYILDE